jgi:hypothetical protein
MCQLQTPADPDETRFVGEAPNILPVTKLRGNGESFSFGKLWQFTTAGEEASRHEGSTSHLRRIGSGRRIPLPARRASHEHDQDIFLQDRDEVRVTRQTASN